MKLSKRNFLILLVAVLILIPLVWVLTPKDITTRVQQAAKRRWLILTGGLVDAGGFRLRMECRGTGSPTVILETGLERNRKTWGPDFTKEIEKFTRVCTYDRAGIGESDPSTVDPRTVGQMVRELHTILQNAGEKGPYLIAGHSIGGLNARLYASLYPQEVAGLVLIDSNHEDQYEPYIKIKPPEEREKFISQLKGANREKLDILASVDEMRKAPGLPSIPLVVLSADRNTFQDPAERELHDKIQSDLADLLPNSKLIVVDGSGHFIYQDKPEAVINGIRDVYEATKKPAS